MIDLLLSIGLLLREPGGSSVDEYGYVRGFEPIVMLHRALSDPGPTMGRTIVFVGHLDTDGASIMLYGSESAARNTVNSQMAFLELTILDSQIERINMCINSEVWVTGELVSFDIQPKRVPVYPVYEIQKITTIRQSGSGETCYVSG